MGILFASPFDMIEIGEPLPIMNFSCFLFIFNVVVKNVFFGDFVSVGQLPYQNGGTITSFEVLTFCVVRNLEMIEVMPK